MTKKDVNIIRKEFNDVPSDEVAEGLIEDLESMMVEKIKLSRQYALEVIWEVGKSLRDTEKKFKVSISALVIRLASDNRMAGRQMGERNLWFSIKVFDSFPKFDEIFDLPDLGENVTVSKLKKLLTTPSTKSPESINLKTMAIKIYEKIGVKMVRKFIYELEKILEDLDK